jgi:HPt (histidine-containing phosphotransfer) domain-containing protein
VLDVEDLLRRCMGNRQFASRIVRAFLAQLEADLSELDTAIAEENAALIAIIAHRVKGASSNVSARRLSQAAAAIGDLATAMPIDMDQVGTYRERLREEQEKFIETSSQI